MLLFAAFSLKFVMPANVGVIVMISLVGSLNCRPFVPSKAGMFVPPNETVYSGFVCVMPSYGQLSLAEVMVISVIFFVTSSNPSCFTIL